MVNWMSLNMDEMIRQIVKACLNNVDDEFIILIVRVIISKVGRGIHRGVATSHVRLNAPNCTASTRTPGIGLLLRAKG